MPPFELEGRRFHSPAEYALALIGRRWTLPVLWRLGRRTWRYNELHRDLKGVSHKMLAQRLRELERDGLVTRTVHPHAPRRIEYGLSEFGRSTLPVIEALRAWGALARQQRRGATKG